MNKAQIERLTQLALAAQGKPTKRPVNEILASERSAAEKFLPTPKAASRVSAETGVSETE